MLRPAEVPIVIRRNQPLEFKIAFPGRDMSGRAFTMEVRSNKAVDAATRLSIGPAAGVLVEVMQVRGQPYTLVTFAAERAAIDALPDAIPLGASELCFYAVKIDGVEYLFGGAEILPTANHL